MSEKIYEDSSGFCTVTVRDDFLPEGTPCGGRVLRSRAELEDAMRAGSVLEGVCQMCDCSAMTLYVDLPGGIRGMIPKAEAAYPFASGSSDGGIKDIAVITRVGKPVRFKITGMRDGYALLSRRAVQERCYSEYVSRLVPGDVIPARITHLEPFGAFCDIGCGLVSLLTVDRISVSRISHPGDRFSQGEDIDAVVSSVDEESGRIYLSHRELLGTWEENAAMFEVGQTVRGVIRSVEEYGVFVELMPNLAGLAEPFEGAEPGMECSVYIKSILPERMKIKLVLIDLCVRDKSSPHSLSHVPRCRRLISSSDVSHISRWLYSPPSASKVIESVFDDCPVESGREKKLSFSG